MLRKIILQSLIILTLLCPSAFAQMQFSDMILTDGIWMDSRAYTSLTAAVNAAGANETDIYIGQSETVTTLTIPDNVRLHFFGDGAINNSGQVTFQTRSITAPNHQIFTGTGNLDFQTGTRLKSAWFANLESALALTVNDSVDLVISIPHTLTASWAVGNNVRLKWESPSCQITANIGTTLSNINQVEAGDYLCFTGSGDFDFVDGVELNLNWFQRLRSALTYIGSVDATIIVPGENDVDFSDTVPANVLIDFKRRNGYFSITAAVTLTFTTPASIIANDDQLIFDGAGDIDFTNPGRACIKWAAATGDGTTDDTTNFQVMTDALAAGSTLYFTPGTYIVSNITSVADQEWKSDNVDQAIIKHKASATDHMIEASDDFRVIGIQFDGNYTNQTGLYACVYYNGSSGSFEARNCKGINMGLSTFYGETISNRFEVSNCTLSSIPKGDGTNPTVAIYVQNGNGYVKVSGNKLIGTPIGPGEYGAGGVQIKGTSAASPLSAEITDNYLSNLGLIISGLYYIGAIDIYDFGRSAIISRNVLLDSTFSPIRVSNTPETTISFNNIDGNDETWTTGGHIYYSGYARTPTGGPFHNPTIAYNVIKDVATGGASIHVVGESTKDIKRPLIAYNKIIGCVNGIIVSYVEDALLVGNLIDGLTGATSDDSAYLLDNNDYEIKISGGQVKNCASYGVYANTGVTSLILTVEGVLFDTNTNQHIYSNGTSRISILSNEFIGTIQPCYLQSGTTAYLRNNVYYGTDPTRYNVSGVTTVYMDESNLPCFETVDNTDTTIIPYGTSDIDSSGGAVAVSLADGYEVGATKFITMSDASTASTVSVTHHVSADPTVLTFNATTDVAMLRFDGTDWFTVYSNGM